MDDNNLITICAICMIVICSISGINLYLIMSTRNSFKTQQTQLNDQNAFIKNITEDMELVISKINLGIKYKVDSSAISILDLSEFKDLDPFIKEKYRKYIVETLTPAIMAGINKSFNDNDMKRYMKVHEAEIDSMIYSIAQKIRYNGIESLPSIMESDVNKVFS